MARPFGQRPLDLVVEIAAPSVEALNDIRDLIVADPEVKDLTILMVLRREIDRRGAARFERGIQYAKSHDDADARIVEKIAMGGKSLWELLARAIRVSGTERHIDGLIDVIGADIPHDLVTVTRYSATKSPEFLKHRRYSDEMVRKYLSIYYVFDPFYAYWRRTKRAGIVPLKTLADDEVKRGQYIAEFLAQSSICDEVGILIEDGDDWCIGIFLDRTVKPFRESEIALLHERLPVFQALHARDVEPRGAHFQRSTMTPGIGVRPKAAPALPHDLWPQLSPRERQLVQLILAGHPNATIAHRLGIQVGTVKNHRLRIYAKLDITTERELFLEFFQHSNQER